MCKADEIAIVDKLEKEYLACPDNYLYKYFTGRNAEWLRNEIKNDFFPALPCDMEVKIVEQAEEINNLKSKLRKSEYDLEKKSRELLQEQLKNNHMKNKNQQAEEIKFELEKTKRDLSQTKRLNNYLKNKLGYARKILNDAMEALNE